MLIDDTHPEETRVVVLDGNRLEDVEFESSSRKQIKGNVYLAKIMRIEPSLQAAFVDYGGNKHGFLAFSEVHPDYYNVSEQRMAEIEKEVDEIIEAKKTLIKEKELERERVRQEKEKAYAEKVAKQNAINNAKEETKVEAETKEEIQTENAKQQATDEVVIAEAVENNAKDNQASDENVEASEEETKPASAHKNRRRTPRHGRITKRHPQRKRTENEDNAEQESSTSDKDENKELKVLAANSNSHTDSISEACQNMDDNLDTASDYEEVETDDDDNDANFELQRKLLISRKLYHNSKIQDVLKEGQIILVQVVKEERGNKGAAMSTYLSLAGRYCVLMPNRIKSGGVSRKITNVADRKRLKSILNDLPLNADMSMIVRTAGEDKTKIDITRDYNYLIRTWNQIKLDSLKNNAPSMIHEEANLIKRALRDMYTKDIFEVIVDGNDAYRTAKNFIKILSPQSLKKIKTCRKNDMPIFQRFQIEGQLEKLHDTNVQLESGGYLVINPTEALVAIDVNSGRATKENNIEETALNTNLEAADEIARQLRLRNLAGLVVIDFIDMDDQANNNAVEKRMRDALKKDRSRVQVGKMSCFGLIEISRQRMHPSFFETSYETCPHCLGKGIVRTVESCSVSILREIESEGIKNRYSALNIFVPSDVAVYLLNQKRKVLSELENKYQMSIIISADTSIKNISQFRIERVKSQKSNDEHNKEDEHLVDETENVYWDNTTNQGQNHNNNGKNPRHDRYKRPDRRNNNYRNRENSNYVKRDNRPQKPSNDQKEKVSWWKRLIGG